MQAMGLMIFFAGGAVLCVALCVMAVSRLRLPWQEALVYFGLAAHPDELERQARPRARAAQRLRA